MLDGKFKFPKGDYVLDEVTKHPYIRVTDFNKDGLDVSNIKYISDNVQKKIRRYTISEDDVYVSIAGTVGLVGVVTKEFDNSNLTENAAKICEIDSSRVDKRFLMYFFRTRAGQYSLLSRVASSSQPKLALERIRKIEVSIYPIKTQKKSHRSSRHTTTL